MIYHKKDKENTNFSNPGPNMHLGIPDWCHMHGSKISVEKLDMKNKTLLLKGSAASCLIQKSSNIYPKSKGWMVSYEVIHSPYSKVNGSIWFSKKDIESAFNLSDNSGKYGNHIIEKYGATVAEQGKYIRWKTYLNIPCPGTAHDGDPNISIHLDFDIKNAVLQLLKKPPSIETEVDESTQKHVDSIWKATEEAIKYGNRG